MLSSSSTLLLNEELYSKVQEPQKALFVLDWLSHLDAQLQLPTTSRVS